MQVLGLTKPGADPVVLWPQASLLSLIFRTRRVHRVS